MCMKQLSKVQAVSTSGIVGSKEAVDIQNGQEP